MHNIGYVMAFKVELLDPHHDRIQYLYGWSKVAEDNTLESTASDRNSLEEASHDSYTCRNTLQNNNKNGKTTKD